MVTTLSKPVHHKKDCAVDNMTNSEKRQLATQLRRWSEEATKGGMPARAKWLLDRAEEVEIQIR
jgi:hypothetical protein